MKRRTLAKLLGSPLEAKILLSHVFKTSQHELFLQDEFDEAILTPFITRRLAGEPLARIIGSHEFYGLNFKLNEATLIPRADTEILVDIALKFNPKHILDLGTGSGCLLIALLQHLPESTGTGVDISEKALEAARENSNKPKFIQSDWFSNVTGQFDLIISNPPYIAKNEKLDKSVLNYDPHLALFAENNGLACYEIIFANAKKHLMQDGHIIVEIGYQQFNEVKTLAEKQGFHLIQATKDLGGHIRALVFTLSPPSL